MNTETATTTEPVAIAPQSLSVTVRRQDRRCIFWAKVIRAGSLLPMPCDVVRGDDVPGSYLREGEEELLPGDFLIDSEQMHHIKRRGWLTRITYMSDDGQARVLVPDSDIKDHLKAAGMKPELLKGSGDIAACIRVAHGVRLGLLR